LVSKPLSASEGSSVIIVPALQRPTVCSRYPDAVQVKHLLSSRLGGPFKFTDLIRDPHGDVRPLDT